MKRIFALAVALCLAFACLAPALAEESADKTGVTMPHRLPAGADDDGPCQTDAGR